MASMGQQFRDGFAAQDAAPDSEGPADLKGPADEADPSGGDVACPVCGASAMKIVQAGQGAGSAPPPMGPMK